MKDQDREMVHMCDGLAIIYTLSLVWGGVIMYQTMPARLAIQTHQVRPPGRNRARWETEVRNTYPSLGQDGWFGCMVLAAEI